MRFPLLFGSFLFHDNEINSTEIINMYRYNSSIPLEIKNKFLINKSKLEIETVRCRDVYWHIMTFNMRLELLQHWKMFTQISNASIANVGK